MNPLYDISYMCQNISEYKKYNISRKLFGFPICDLTR